MTGLEDALKAKDYSAAMDAIPWDKLDQMQYDIDPELRSVLFKAGAVAARQLLPKGIKISFDQTNPAAVEWVRAHAAELVTQNIIPTTQESIRKILTRAFEEGITPADAARLIREYIGILPRHADAVEKYRQALIKKFRDDYKYVTWESDSARLAGRYAQQLINYRAKNIARTECLPGDTLVDGAVVGAVYRRWYEGYLIEVVTSNGRIFSASPNHPMLASVGWVTAEQLTESNYLICNTGKKDICSTSNLNVKRNPSTISEIFDSVQAISAFERRNSIPPDFHGDGRYGYVDILTPNRELTIGRFAPISQPLGNEIFSESDKSRARFCNKCGRFLAIDKTKCRCSGSYWLTGLFEDAKNRSIAHIKGMSDCLSGFTRDVTSHYQLRGQVRMAIPGGSALGIENMPSLGSRAANSGSVNKLPNRFKVGRHNTGDALNAIASEIELDRIISVRLRSFSGHIFNLSTMDGYYTINKGLYTGNTIRASNEGQQQLWNQAIEQELIDPNEWEREWIADETERTCEICMGLDGTRAPIDGTFEGGYARPPDPHPSCRCAVGLVRKE